MFGTRHSRSELPFVKGVYAQGILLDPTPGRIWVGVNER